MNQELTNEQVIKLFAWCEKYEVYDYDLQIEIVDHLASAIEHQWEINPELSFGWALKNIRDKFGWRDFRKLERKITRQLKRKFYRLLMIYFFEYFRLPKVLITLGLSLMLFTIFQLTDNDGQVILFYIIPIAVFSLYYHYVLFPKRIELKSETGKSFLILTYLNEINKRIGLFVFFPLWMIFFNVRQISVFLNNPYKEACIACCLSVFTIFIYGYFFYLPHKVKAYFVKNYVVTS